MSKVVSAIDHGELSRQRPRQLIARDRMPCMSKCTLRSMRGALSRLPSDVTWNQGVAASRCA